ncbi:MAG: hypothetical protein ACYS29_18830, partial [Planctomycetota bacterium]
VECIKRCYYVPVLLVKTFVEWCKPGRDYSHKVSGLMLCAMALDDHALLVKLGKLAHSDALRRDAKTGKVVGKAIDEARKLIIETVLRLEPMNALVDMVIQRAIRTKDEGEKEFCLEVLRVLGRDFESPKTGKAK